MKTLAPFLSFILVLLVSLSSSAKTINIADACPVAPTPLAFGDLLKATKSTAGLSDDFGTSGGWQCGDMSPSSAPDAVFAVTLPQDGVLDVRVTSKGALNPALYLQPSCGVEWACFDWGTKEERIFGHYPAGTYHVILDGDAGSSGGYSLAVGFAAPACGDGALSPGEECDAGAGSPGDGCTACTLDPPGVGDACPGEALAIGPGTTVFAGTTYGYNDSFAGSCSWATGGADRVFALTPSSSGILTATVGLSPDGVTPSCSQDIYGAECRDRVLYLRSTCTDAATETACSDVGAASAESVSAAVTAGVAVFLVVDGFDDQDYSRGPFHLRIDLN